MSGLSIRSTEQIRCKWFPGQGTLSVSAIREASLNEDLTEIQRRRLQHITVASDRPTEEIPLLRLGWSEAQWLAAALTAALDATRDLRPEDDQ